MRLEEIREVSLSPDGEWLAYVLKRSKVSSAFHGAPNLVNNDHADIWIARVSGGQPQNVTNGAVDDSGYWAPKWSPDGMRLAMLSTKGGNVRVWLWTRSSKRLEMLTDHSVDPVVGPDATWDPYVWISNHQLLVKVLPLGQRPLALAAYTRVAEITAREWAKAWKGQEPTASALDSGTQVDIKTRPQGQILIIHINSRTQQLVSTGANFGQAVLSPDKSRLAFLKQVDVWQPDPNKSVTRIMPVVYQVMITELREPSRTYLVQGVREVLQGSLLWSPDGNELALIGTTSESTASDSTDLAVFRCRIADFTCRSVTATTKDLDYYKQNRVGKALMWIGKNELLVFAGSTGTSTQGYGRPQQTRWPWLGIDDKGQLYSFFRKMKGSPPSQFLPEAKAETVIGLIDGGVWRIGSDGQAIENLTSDFKPRISSLVWPDLQSSDAKVRNTLIFRVNLASTDELYILDIKSREVKQLMKPSPEASLVAFNSEKETAVFRSDLAGTCLWAKDARAKEFWSVVETNTFLRDIQPGKLRKIEYRSLDGQELKGWLILPYGYKEGTRLPLVTWVYAGIVYTDAPPQQYPFGQQDVLNPQLLAAHGYAVLLPSMPLKPYGEIEDPYMQLTKGVLPAVDKLVDLGIVDPKRMGVMGWSYGGYSVYGLITQTNRFQAAIAGAGVSNLVSLYGTFSAFDGRSRYDTHAHEDPFRMWNVETQAMGGPPWKTLGRYLRNSPINYADRVETPLMIIHGDLDTIVGIEQAEEFFTALYRQNKRAMLLRYWGEWHGINSPANVRDMWQRIYAWFDEYLAPQDKP